MLGIIQVAIGLIFVYYLTSILVATINVAVSNVLKMRAKYLEREIANLLADEPTSNALMTHQLIQLVKNIVPGGTNKLREFFGHYTNNEVHGDVTNIDSKVFAQVLITILNENANAPLYEPFKTVIATVPDVISRARMQAYLLSMRTSGVGLEGLKLEIGKLPEDATRSHLRKALVPIETQLTATRPDTGELGRLLPTLIGLSGVSPQLQDALQVVVNTANSIEELQANIENWFDARMDQLSKEYKRRLGLFSAIIGLILALILNIDSVQLARALWSDSGLRETVISAVQGAVANQPAADTATETESSADLEATIKQARETLDEMFSLNLPIGWESTPVDGGCIGDLATLPDACTSTRNILLILPANNSNILGWLASKIIGIAITTLAITQGAPFWFDLLRKLSGNSSSGSGASSSASTGSSGGSG